MVNKAFQVVETAKLWMDKLDAAFEDAKQTFSKAHMVFVKQPIAPTQTEPPSQLGVTYLLRELNTRALVRPSATSDFPEEVFVRDQATQELVPAASYAPPRVPCMREYKYADQLSMIRYTCAATTEDCVAARGTAFDRRPDCESWCDDHDEPKAMLASYLPDKHLLTCYQQQCNDEFVNGSFQPKLNEEACALGCAPELCIGEKGACEIPTENAQGQHYVVCKEGLTKGFCEAGPTPEAFQPGKKCVDVGYPYWNAAQGVWRMTPPTTYDAGAPKLDAGAGTDAPRTDAGAGTDADAPGTDADGRRGHDHQGVWRAVRDPGSGVTPARELREVFHRLHRVGTSQGHAHRPHLDPERARGGVPQRLHGCGQPVQHDRDAGADAPRAEGHGRRKRRLQGRGPLVDRPVHDVDRSPGSRPLLALVRDLPGRDGGLLHQQRRPGLREVALSPRPGP